MNVGHVQRTTILARWGVLRMPRQVDFGEAGRLPIPVIRL